MRICFAIRPVQQFPIELIKNKLNGNINVINKGYKYRYVCEVFYNVIIYCVFLCWEAKRWQSTLTSVSFKLLWFHVRNFPARKLDRRTQRKFLVSSHEPQFTKYTFD